jgi:hypothetical protein
MKAISKMMQNSEAVPEDIRTGFAIADTALDATDAIFSISKAVYCNHDLPLPVKKAWLAHLQFVIAGAKAFAEENGIPITEEES